MSAYVPLSPNTVTWAINGVVGGNATFGTVTPTGLYTPPAAVPAEPGNVITVKVASTADPAKFGTATLTITKPQTWVWSVFPSSFPAGAVNLSVNGSNFVPGAVATINNQPLPTVFVSSTKLTVAATIPEAMMGTAQIRAVNPAPGATTSTPVNVTVTAAVPPVTVSVNPPSASMVTGALQQFAATVTGNANTSVTWTATAGTISSGGLYMAPASLPNPPTATVRATSVADNTKFATATVSLTAGVTITLTPPTAQVTLGAAQQFTATVTNAQNPAVTWSVNNVAGGNSVVGTISSGGLYTAPAALPNPAQVTVRATSVQSPASFAQSAVAVLAPAVPPPPAVNLTHARFLEQAAFGPTTAELANIGQLGINAWLDQQFAMPETFITVPGENSAAAQQYLSRLVMAPDQLRQRMINALAKIVVISGNKNIYPNELVPYWQILSRNAFGSYRQLLWEVTVSPQMGKYLDLANSMKAVGAGGTNENYARELMQLFTIGLVKLNGDGTPQLDGQGKTIPTYDQATVVQVARALTGWTYPSGPGGNMTGNNWEAFHMPMMEVRENNHDTSFKTLPNGCTIPSGQTVAAETGMVLDCLMAHPNVGPFIVQRLIRDIVTSNPSPAYVQRVVNVWNNNGNGIKGDLKAVLKAILIDAEARQDQATPQQGRLKDAIYHFAAFIRGLNGSLNPQNYRPWELSTMGMAPLSPPSVFSFYSALYRIPGSALAGPEFQIYTPTESMIRGNFFYAALTQPNASDMKVDLTPFNAVANDSNAIIERVNNQLLYGRMPQAMKTSLAAAMSLAPDNNQRVITALYLTVLSGQYTVQY
jgi:uncharacterized protein (DUF1800 family)